MSDEDPSKLSDEELKQRYAASRPAPSTLSDDELKQQYAASQRQRGTPKPPPPIIGGFDPNDVPSGGGTQQIVEGIGKSMSDMWLGARQFGASLGMGDKEALAKEAADKEQIDKPLMSTVGGNVGKYGFDIASALIPGGASLKATKFLPTLLKQGATGAVMGELNPDENYNPVKNALVGAAFGAGGEVLGRGVGKLAAPFRKASPAGAEASQILESAGLPSPLAINRFDTPIVQQLTNAAEMLGGTPITKSREKNLEWLTNLATEGTGQPTKFVTQEWRDNVSKALDTEVKAFRAGPTVSLVNVDPVLQAEIARMAPKSIVMQGNARTARQTMMGVQQGIAQVPTVTADTAMSLRRDLSDTFYSKLSNRDYDGAKAAMVTRDAIDKAIKDSYIARGMPERAAAFDTWRQQFGRTKDVFAAADKGTEGGRLIPKNIAEQLLPKGVGESTPFEKIIRASESGIPVPPQGGNRSWLSRLLLGSGVAGGVGGLSAVNPLLGAASGITSAALWNAVARKPMSRESTEAIRRLLAGTVTGIGSQ